MSRAVRSLSWMMLLALTATPVHADVTLIDDQGLELHFDTDVQSGGQDVASGAITEAAFTSSLPATTSMGGTTSTILTDMVDGYSGLGFNFGPSAPAFAPDPGDGPVYAENGPATFDSSCGSRQLLLPVQTINAGTASIEVSRKVFVPQNDTFIRWYDVIRNVDDESATFHVGYVADLGSDSNTIVTATSDGDTTVELTDTWLATMQNYDTGFSRDPRLGAVLRGPGTVDAPLQVLQVIAVPNGIVFWWYTLTLAPGQTKALLTYATGQPTKAAAAAKAVELASLTNDHALDCFSPLELVRIANFNAQCLEPSDEGTSCDDNDLCTESDVCTSGRCVGAAKECRTDAADCTGVCNPGTGVCDDVDVLDDTLCANGDLCDGPDSCQAGTCEPDGNPLRCNDKNPCTTDSCAAASGCANVVMSNCVPCSNGEDGGTDDNDAGIYQSCADDNQCNGAELCGQNGMCHGGTALNCDDGDPCTVDSCAMADGCHHEPIPSCMACDDDADCNDGDACDGPDVCSANICDHGTEVNDCDDGDPCTADSCVAADGCRHTPIATVECAGAAGRGGRGGPTGGRDGRGATGGSGASPADAGVDAAVDAGTADSDDGCDCSTTSHARGTSALMWLMVLGWIARRRRG